MDLNVEFPKGKFVFLDVETANAKNNTICAIGLIVVEDGVEVENCVHLINPNSEFSYFNIKIHGITPEMVKDAIDFEEFWMKYEPHFDEKSIIVAHNTNFDLSVIKKDLSRYMLNLNVRKYLDTVYLFKKFYYKGNAKAGDCKLNNISDLLGIELEHHDAHSDTKACFEIFKYVISNYEVSIQSELKMIKA